MFEPDADKGVQLKVMRRRLVPWERRRPRRPTLGAPASPPATPGSAGVPAGQPDKVNSVVRLNKQLILSPAAEFTGDETVRSR